MGQNRAHVARWQNARWDIGWRIKRCLAHAWADILAAEQGRFALWLPVFMGAGVLAYDALRAEPPAWIGADKLEAEMFKLARNLEFEQAARLRDEIHRLRSAAFGVPDKQAG